jgi:sulfatase modifying factor 1
MLAAASFSGCLVSFDGYELADAGGSDNGTSGSGGTATSEGGSSTRGGSQSVAGGGGHVSNGGANGEAGMSTVAGNAGAVENGGALGGGAGGATGASGAGGVSTAGSAGKAGGAGASASGAGGALGNAGGGGGGASAGSGGASGGTGGSCPIAPAVSGTTLVQVPLPGGGFFCMDRTEVTNKNYSDWLATKPSTANQSAACTFNTDFTPAVDATNCTQYDVVNHPNVPIACVDWCDAQAYCAWAGKRLCGKIGGGSNAPADFADPAKSEWYTACSHDGLYQFPYGTNKYDATACIGLDDSTRPTAVPTPTCQGGYDGVYDLSGNVAEWENSCSANSGATDQCLYRGGSYADYDTSTPSLQCNSGVGTAAKSAAKARSTRDKTIGFRCCADPAP